MFTSLMEQKLQFTESLFLFESICDALIDYIILYWIPRVFSIRFALSRLKTIPAIVNQ